jgi:hypothetical protein
MIDTLYRFWHRHGLALCALGIFAIAAYGGYQYARPLDVDNTITLSFLFRADVSEIFSGPFPDLPAYRPIAYAVNLLEYRLFGMRFGSYFLFNVVVWAACALLLYLVAHRITRSRLAAAAAAALFAVDGRNESALYWLVEVQSTLAVAFGLAAVFIVAATPSDARITPIRAVVIGACLLVSALCKEFGLTFSAVVVLIALLNRQPSWRRLLASSAIVVGIYIFSRVIFGGAPALDNYCEIMGFFFNGRYVCYRDFSMSDRVQQYIWNSFATTIGTFLPTLFSVNGSFDPRFNLKLFNEVCIVALFMLALIKQSRLALAALSIILISAALNFPIFRPRNHLVGMTGLYIGAALGLTVLFARLPRRSPRAWMASAVMLVMSFIIAYRALDATSAAAGYVARSRAFDPCRWSDAFYPETLRGIDQSAVTRLKTHYRLDDPTCQLPPPLPTESSRER